MDKKKFWLSKTFWINLVVPVVSYFYPPANEFIVSHPSEVVAAWAAINMILRWISKSEVVLID